MASGGKRGGAGERVLESRHVIGLFMLMLLFSGVFFTLGYVMGRNDDRLFQEAGEFRFSQEGREFEANQQSRPCPGGEGHSGASEFGLGVLSRRRPQKNRRPSEARGVLASVGSKKCAGARQDHGPAQNQRRSIEISERPAHSRRRLHAASGGPDQRSRWADKYYHVQVGPYADPKAADAARKGLQGAGFKAIVKH